MPVREHAGLAQALPMARGVQAAIAGAVGAAAGHPALCGHLRQRVPPLRTEPHRCGMDGRPGDGSAAIPLGVDEGEPCLALGVLGAGRAEAIPPFLATV